eukprot:CAMPEP_0194039162 /NCGR_PEP_ID=MMETSP0009_2-20130614/11322_1 /TAXON_ID=210454 /ORGANISM="Grammatophora oceanica, Strain CCMP 410" /LENGTH=541 /DNA_ID=CAMNT_0038681903 /DNA_START=54 /DNA_END=1679 /DNA_ORIENTATION=-
MTTNRNKNLRDDERWNENLKRLVTFKNKFNHTNVPIKYTDDGDNEDADGLVHLGSWVHHQRKEYRIYQNTNGEAGKMTPWRIAKLNKIDFQWNPGNRNDGTWKAMFQELVSFKQKYNSTKVPQLGSKDEKNDPPYRKLLKWVEKQQSQYNRLKRNETSQLTPDRVQLLESIGMSLSSKPVTDDEKWLKPYYFKLVSLQHQYNITDVSEHFSKHRGLAKWVEEQKREYDEYMRSGEGSMTAWRFGLLKSINFARMRTASTTKPASGAISRNERWTMMYSRLLAYKQQYNSTLVPQMWQKDRSLGSWVGTQRKNYGQFANITAEAEFADGHQGKVGDTVGERLTSSIALAFGYSHPGQTKNGVTVEEIVYRISRLNDIGFVWDPLEEQWKEKYDRLVAFQKDHNSTLVPRDYDADPELGNWVQQQRDMYGEFASIVDAEELKESIRRAKTGLTVEGIVSRITRLNDVGFVWDPLVEHWMESYTKLIAYKMEFNSTLVPFNYDAEPGLGPWVTIQRVSKRRRTLSKEQIRHLELIDFVWDVNGT